METINWPSGDHARGIDVSHHRGVVDWAAVAASGISFGIVKATDGIAFVDPRFDANWTGMRRAGVLRGAYHFFRPQNDPRQQAAHYLARVGDILHQTDLPPVLDFEAYPQTVRQAFEALSLSQRIKRLQIWLETVAQATGRTPLLYTNLFTWQELMGNTTAFSRYPLWIANYNVSRPNLPAEKWGGKGWLMWQFGYQGAVPGVNDGGPPVDVNIFRSTPAQLKKWLRATTPRPPAPQITNGQVMEALLLAAKRLNVDPQLWTAQAGLAYLVTPADNASRPYDGPIIENLKLSTEARLAISQSLDDLLAGQANAVLSLTNQQVINIVYRAAGQLGIAGWTLLEKAGLADLINVRQGLYLGPDWDELPNLTADERQAISAAASGETVIEGPPPAENPPVEQPPVPPPPVEAPPVEAPLSLTNQQLINAVYRAAGQLAMPGWHLLQKAGLSGLVADREAIYEGPSLTELSGLNDRERQALAAEIGLAPPPPNLTATYPGLLNQDVVNIFYRAAGQFNENGWHWIGRVGLAHLAETRQTRYQPYTGPKFDQISLLDAARKAALQTVLGVFQAS